MLMDPFFMPLSDRSDLIFGVRSSTLIACRGGPTCDVGILTSKYVHIGSPNFDSAVALRPSLLLGVVEEEDEEKAANVVARFLLGLN
eukprot:CAMPEP_0203660792 /NCGR_PEP_ID=MMETSP0088-20131115/57932_1 /ASSEMBLY_ACC=CAM_ASM_001087 /TAXON_ID=426623 /ORGANISM="Chaetoceros affinis, Strain CCMP159" /LENGTH=86 /DNA_ID=CAMNT_0050523293 /DNA_START=398 /DNA_END=655 /DNA_ORIENTATION=+